MIGKAPITQDNRSIAGRRRTQAQRKMNDVTIKLVKQALDEGVPADYVLFDSWFSSPKMFWQLKQLGLDSVGMLKQSKKVHYRYCKRLYDVKELYARLAASRIKTKENYLYSSVVEAEYQGHVFAINRGKGKKYLVLASTNISLRPEGIIQLYGRRWQIKTYFKTAKQYLALDKSQIQSYDGECGYIAVTALTYDLLAWQERLNTDDRTMGDLFYLMNEALPDLTFEEALVYLITELKEAKVELTEKIAKIIDQFILMLPKFIKKILKEPA